MIFCSLACCVCGLWKEKTERWISFLCVAVHSNVVGSIAGLGQR